MVIGGCNGLLVTRARIPSFIVTLGTMKILRSVAYAVSNGKSVSVFPESATESWVWVLGKSIGIIPVQVILMLILFAVGYVVLKRHPMDIRFTRREGILGQRSCQESTQPTSSWLPS